MTTVREVFGGDHYATSYNGLGTGLTGVPRAGIAAGTADHVIINNGSGVLSSEAALLPLRGGTGLDTSAATGVAKVTAGTWSITTLVNADINAAAAIARSKIASGTASHVIINDGSGVLSSEAQLLPLRGGTGTDSSASTGIPHVSAGTWTYSLIVNADINAAAAIARTKIASGTASHVVINDGSGVLSSEAQLSVARGGTGTDFSAIGTGLNVVTITSGVFSAGTQAVTAATPNTIVLRDGSGNIAVASLTVSTLSVNTITTPSGDLTINPAGTNVAFGENHITMTASTVAGGASDEFLANVQTTNATATTLATIPTASGGANGTCYTIRACITFADVTGASNTGAFDYILKAKNIGGTVSVSSLVSVISIADGTLSTTNVSASVSGVNVLLRVVGLAATTINWCGKFEIVAQNF